MVGALFGVAAWRDLVDHQQTGPHLGCQFHRLGEALLDLRLHYQPVHNYLYVVLLVLVQDNAFRQVSDPAVHPHPDKALLADLPQHILVFPLAAPHHRRQQLDTGTFRKPQDVIHHLLDGLAGHRPAAFVAMGLPDTGIQQAQVVVDFGDGAHGGAGIAAGGLLLDGNGR